MKSDEIQKGNLPFAGLEFVITGKLESSTRPDAESKIKMLGGKAGSDVTRKTSYLVVGADPGSKLTRARSFGITIINEEEFLHTLEQALKSQKSDL